MVTCDQRYKVTWFGRPVPNIFILLNILNLPGLPFFASSSEDLVDLIFNPQCWFKINNTVLV